MFSLAVLTAVFRPVQRAILNIVLGNILKVWWKRHETAGHWSWFIMKRAIVVRMVAGVRNILRRARVNGIFENA